MLFEHQRSDGLGMGALVTVCSRNTNVLMIWFWFQGSRRIRVRAQQDSGGSGNVQARVRAQVPLSSSVWHDTSAGPTDVYNSSLLIRNDSHHRVHSNTNAIMLWAWMLQ